MVRFHHTNRPARDALAVTSLALAIASIVFVALELAGHAYLNRGVYHPLDALVMLVLLYLAIPTVGCCIGAIVTGALALSRRMQRTHGI